MKKTRIFGFLLAAFMLFGATAAFAQMTTYTWEPYKTKFKVPSDFEVTASSGEEWSGTNGDITMSIYPRKGEDLTYSGMKSAVYSWAVDNGVTGIGEATELDEEKLNGYWGIMYEGNQGEFPVATMLIIDPDYPDISIYIWVSYRAGYSDTVLDMLMSFTPN